jgi:hypothetical protein
MKNNLQILEDSDLPTPASSCPSDLYIALVFGMLEKSIPELYYLSASFFLCLTDISPMDG